MEAWAKVLAGLAFLIISLGYLYRPPWVLRLNAWGRANIFNDSYVLLYRRRWGLLLFVVAILFFYSGFVNMAHLRSREKPSTYLELTDAYHVFRAEQYRGTIVRCQEILKRDKDNVHAWALLGSAWSALGRTDQARSAWEQVLKRDPDHPVAGSPVFEKGKPPADGEARPKDGGRPADARR